MLGPRALALAADLNKAKGLPMRKTCAVLGERFEGVLVSDCLSIYDLQEGEQHKCYAHHLKAMKAARLLDPENGTGFLDKLANLLKKAITLGNARGEKTAEQLEREITRLESESQALLSEPRKAAHEEAVRKRIDKQKDHLFTFLRHQGVDATNNLAERQLRPVVIARKISCGNKTSAGAATFERLASLAATAVQTGKNFIAQIAAAMPLNSS